MCNVGEVRAPLVFLLYALSYLRNDFLAKAQKYLFLCFFVRVSQSSRFWATLNHVYKQCGERSSFILLHMENPAVLTSVEKAHISFIRLSCQKATGLRHEVHSQFRFLDLCPSLGMHCLDYRSFEVRSHEFPKSVLLFHSNIGGFLSLG